MLPMFFEYETLRLIWWLLIGVLLIGFALTDGFDLGVGALLPFIARTDEERRLVINSIGATWEGNQVWFILGGGAIFAAWPFVYAISFSGLYLAMFVVLCALILRPVGFKYRSKHKDPKWRARWDWALFIGGFVPALVFGVAVGNVLAGVPFTLDSDLRSRWEGGLLDLFTPLPLVAGLLSVAMLVLHGAGWLSIKIEQGPVLVRARRWGQGAAIAAIALFAVGGLMLAYGDYGFRLVGTPDTNGPSNPLFTGAEAAPGAWLENYGRYPWMLAAPVMGFAGPLVALLGIVRRADLPVFLGSSLAVIGTIGTAGLSMFPFMLPSSVQPAASLTVWNASSSAMTLWIMLIVTAIFLPLVLLYTAWVFRVLFGRITTEQVRNNPDFY
ncbi:cytochrome d ubiquinol oxidase subunit II [Polymorphobacter multimanifer]|uniref:Cytochrome d ubiquinol oxidase subunit II n=2 Tax=Polymorphobacter multimanifer TaxID=1070431 RepID=A0A841L946_9SPHN|nr:cytochrome d ubiquinol oxidase subunit II [Polymorphobacter multimanifer]GGI87010.1 cytochrome d ubiquinol oxidase subunit II [Polymorphobacter multimanifer]